MINEGMDGGKGIGELLAKTRSAMLLANNFRTIVDANRPACEMLGLDREELLGLKIEDFSAPELREVAPEMFAAFLEAGSQAGPFELIRKDGSTVHCSYSASANVAPGVHLSILIPVHQTDEELDELREDAPDVAEELPELTRREREILTLLALGETNVTISQRLHLAPETVRAHTRSARLRLGAKSRSHAIALALKSGQLALDSSD